MQPRLVQHPNNNLPRVPRRPLATIGSDGEQAAPADGGKDQRDGKPSDEHGDSRNVSDKDHAQAVRA